MKKRFLTILIILLFVGIILTAGCVVPPLNPQPTLPTSLPTSLPTTSGTVINPQLSITKPLDKSTVEHRTTVSGTSTEIDGKSTKLYVLIKPANYSWWVQEPVTLRPNGSWYIEAYIGEPDKDIGRDFTVMAISTKETLTTGELKRSLPEIINKAEILVTRK